MSIVPDFHPALYLPQFRIPQVPDYPKPWTWTKGFDHLKVGDMDLADLKIKGLGLTGR